MKKLAMMLALVALIGCAGKKYGATEGPFRAKFMKAYSFSYVGQQWSMPIFFLGVLPEGPIHVEGYLLNNGAKYQQHHSDQEGIRTRMVEVDNKFTAGQFCESAGRPMDRLDPDAFFWGRGSVQDPMDQLSPVPEDAANETVAILFQFYRLRTDGHGKEVPGKMLTEAKTKVRLSCPECTCGGNFR